MQYAFLAYANEAAWANLPAPERQAVLQKFGVYAQEIERRGVIEAVARLQPSNTALTVHAQDGKLAVDNGPYTQSKEQIFGIYILNCKDLDEAKELAEKLPTSQFGYVEVRPISGYQSG